MDKARAVQLLLSSTPSTDGAGVRLHRVFGYHQINQFDPFLMLDHFGDDDPANFLPGFPWHPHRGIETITYMQTGSAEHGDSIGNSGVIGPGDVQWMTAGSGILHQEMPKPDAKGRMYGFQLWTNLPAQQKMMPPRYRDVLAKDIPEHQSGNSRIKVISGNFAGTQGPVRDIVTDPHYYIVNMPASEELKLPVHQDYTCFIYCYEGSLLTANQEVKDHQVALMTDGDHLLIKAGSSGCGFLFLMGKALHEQVAWGGPIVMNTREELRLAFKELDEGTFIK